MPQNAFFLWTRDLLVSQKMTQRHFFFSILHQLSPVILANSTIMAFSLFRNSTFNFHCCTQCEATPPQKSARKWRCDLSRLLARKITKGIHSCKPVSLNCPTDWCWMIFRVVVKVGFHCGPERKKGFCNSASSSSFFSVPLKIVRPLGTA